MTTRPKHSWVNSNNYIQVLRWAIFMEQNMRFGLVLKSDNLQYDTLVRWFAGANDLLTKPLIFQVFFYIISCKILCLSDPANQWVQCMYYIVDCQIFGHWTYWKLVSLTYYFRGQFFMFSWALCFCNKVFLKIL